MARTTRKMTDNPVVQRIVGLIREQGRNEKKLTVYRDYHWERLNG